MRITKKDFGKRLKADREALGLTQTDLAEVVGVRQKSVSEWETGLKQPPIETLGRIAQALHTTVGWLVAGEGSGQVRRTTRGKIAEPDGEESATRKRRGA